MTFTVSGTLSVENRTAESSVRKMVYWYREIVYLKGRDYDRIKEMDVFSGYCGLAFLPAAS